MENTAHKLTLIKRSSPPCPDCNAMQFALLGSNIPFNEIDIALEPEAVEKYGITSVPVFLIDDGKGGHIRLNGKQPIQVIEEMLED